MASRSPLSEEALSCPVCCDIYKDPVILKCSHSFCKACLQEYWKDKEVRECPLCRRQSSADFPPNLALKDLCEAFSRKRGQSTADGSLCSLHGEQLKSFCVDDLELICWVCRDSKRHHGHRFRPVDEATLDHKEELRKSLETLKKKLKTCGKVKEDCDQTADHIHVQAQHTKKQIKEEFKRLHTFLEEEEEARIAALGMEEERKSQMMKEKIEGLNGEISTLSDTIRAIEEALRADDISFLQNNKAMARRAQRTLPDPQPASGALIDVAKHLGNLTFRVWDKMRGTGSYSPVILDPNTAHPELILSEDLTAVTNSEARQRRPHNPERFKYRIFALGSEGFNAGTHRWDVEVGCNARWLLGVVVESVQRRGDAEYGCWALVFNHGKYTAVSPPGLGTLLPVSQNPRRIRIQLDCARGTLSFFNPETGAHLHTFTHAFTERVFPCFCNRSTRCPLKILPVKVSLKVEKPGDS